MLLNKWSMLFFAGILLGSAVVSDGIGFAEDNQYKPTLYAELPDDMFGPDAMFYDEAAKTLFLSVPNFILDSKSDLPNAEAAIAKINVGGKVEKFVTFPVIDGIGHVGCMGIEKGPDGHFYVCDNQYFFDKDCKSRLLRVVMKEGKPTGEVQVVVDGFRVANAVLWDGERVFVTDTILDEPGKYGSGGIWMFAKEEILLAGRDADHPKICVAKRNDPRLILTADCDDIGRGNNCGADGITKDDKGNYYFGHYGDGAMYRFRFDETGNPEMERIHKGGELFRCADGICYDKTTDKIYITDSADNSIWAFTPTVWGEPVHFERLWENDDTDGTDGLLDLPCECRVVGNQLVIVNQDVGAGATGKNQKTDKPYSLSAIKIH